MRKLIAVKCYFS